MGSLSAGRDAPPTHYSFKIQSFSSLSKASIEKYTSDKFEAGDYKWKLSIYPNGNKKRNGEGHISITLALVDTSSLPAGWEVKVIFNFFIHDQFHDKYVSLTVGELKRFHAMKTEWGIYKFLKLENFTDPSNGYLVNDSCAFGVEVFVLKQTRKEECLSVMEAPVTYTHTWKMKSFSSLAMERYESQDFVVGDHKWRIRLYPRGNGEGKGNSISVFLTLDNSTLPPDTKLFVRFNLRTVNQMNGEHFELKDDNHFSASWLVWGSRKYMSLAKLNDPKHGFLVDDTCIIEAQVTLLGIVSPLS
ncbi:MATH domain and coiled-coil domain-containing protein At2g05420-like isoform X2 [Cornus florida]|uniref:MATH domain and coiled-coil domain-containing protein At2g05420-like isoform X2 n=1 Tax=Cornus florida TaxID=4283 RepID=UPI00289D92C6|nr:MATH domain and coiled-coil domain-containing protein At2g05420-like isoform X2 [Cornus florida]